ncbi:transmembrane protein [Pseudoscourfieldia marina]
MRSGVASLFHSTGKPTSSLSGGALLTAPLKKMATLSYKDFKVMRGIPTPRLRRGLESCRGKRRTLRALPPSTTTTPRPSPSQSSQPFEASNSVFLTASSENDNDDASSDDAAPGPLEAAAGYAYTVGVVFLLIRVLKRRANRATTQKTSESDVTAAKVFGIEIPNQTPLQRREDALRRAREEADRPLPEPVEAYKGAAAATLFGVGVLLAAGQANEAIDAMPAPDAYFLRNASEALKLIASGGLYLTGFLCIFTGLGIGAFGLQVQFAPDKVLESRKSAAERKEKEVERLASGVSSSSSSASASSSSASASSSSSSSKTRQPEMKKKENPWRNRPSGGGMAGMADKSSKSSEGGANLGLLRDDGPIGDIKNDKI